MPLSNEKPFEFQVSSSSIESPFPSSFQSFSEEPTAPEEEEYSTYVESDSPFPSIYELENPLEPQGIVAPEMEEYVAFLNELYDEEFNDAIADLRDEAIEIYHESFASEYGNPSIHRKEAEILLEAHFEPISYELEDFIEGLVNELEQIDLDNTSLSDVESLIDQYAPVFEGGIGKRLRRGFKKIGRKARKAVEKVKDKVKSVAKNTVKTLKKDGIKGVIKKGFKAAKRGLKKGAKAIKRGIQKGGKFIKKKMRSALKKLKKLVKPLLKRVLMSALDRLPSQYRLCARSI